ncbi:hypothetical protein O988_07897 [Pseudogymnoascus sp. VKM F-3808]|nr:hypothetical protein O988_07897 [Pseudogymnoascus sp. VKM F-3808]
MDSPRTPSNVTDKERPQKIVVLKLSPNTDVEAAAEVATMKNLKKTSFKRPQEIVYVIVGRSKQKFGMHKDHLCATSQYFKAALEGNFEEAELGEVALADTSVSAFGLFNEWLYTGKIAEELCQEEGLTNVELYNKDRPTFRQLLDAWNLADYLLVPQLQNHIMDMMQAKYEKRKVVPKCQFSYFYEHTQAGSPMRKFLVDLCVWRWYGQSENYTRHGASIPPEMAMELVVALARRLEERDTPFFVTESYHVPLKA